MSRGKMGSRLRLPVSLYEGVNGVSVTLDEARVYLRVDGEVDDEIITSCLEKAHALCQAVSRLDDEAFTREENSAAIKIAVLYAVGYLYQNREGANHQELVKTLRALLMDVRREVF